jgi:Fur family transcriptional regulator, ferric uptake regulator
MSQAGTIMAKLGVRGVRNTAPRRAVVTAALSRSRAFTAQELVKELDGVGRATVFRTLDLLVQVGALSRMHAVIEGERCFRYTRCEPEHHHHLRCRSCGRVDEIDAPDLERRLSAIARRRGFVPVAHEVEIAGLCPRCRQ